MAILGHFGHLSTLNPQNFGAVRLFFSLYIPPPLGKTLWSVDSIIVDKFQKLSIVVNKIRKLPKSEYFRTTPLVYFDMKADQEWREVTEPNFSEKFNV